MLEWLIDTDVSVLSAGSAAAARPRRRVAFAHRLIGVALRQLVDSRRPRRPGAGGRRRAARARGLAGARVKRRRRRAATVAIVRWHLVVDVVHHEIRVALLAVAVLHVQTPAKPKFHLARHVTSRHVRRVERVETSVSSSSCRAVLFDKLERPSLSAAKRLCIQRHYRRYIMAVLSYFFLSRHRQNAWARHVERGVVSRRDKPSGIWAQPL